MAGTFKFFADAALTLPIQAGAPFASSVNYDGSSGNVDYAVWLGSNTAGQVLQAASSPGTDPLTVTVHDTSPGSGQPAAFSKIALTQVGLDTATQSLDVGATVLGGVANAVAVWTRDNISGGTPAVGLVATNLEWRILGCAETTA